MKNRIKMIHVLTTMGKSKILEMGDPLWATYMGRAKVIGMQGTKLETGII